MNCNEVKIWLTNSSDEELLNPGESIRKHLSSCSDCSTKVNIIKQAVNYIDVQKKEFLSEKRSQEIIENLLSSNALNKTIKLEGRYIISRIAAIFIIAFGLLTGIVAGQLLFTNDTEQDNPWSSEFKILSDNSEFSLFE